MARKATMILTTCLLLAAAGCGGGGDAASGSDAAEARAGWIGGEAVPLRGPSGRMRVIAFLRPHHAPSLRLGRALEAVRLRHAGLDVIALTASHDAGAVESLRAECGASYPICFGVAAEERAVYGFQQAPSVQVIDEDGAIVGRDLIALEARLD